MSSDKLPVVSGSDAAKAGRIGFVLLRKRGKGSHKVMRRDNPAAILTIPDDRELRPGTLRSLIRVAGLTVREFNELL